MFAARYFAPRYFPTRYFCKTGAVAAVINYFLTSSMGLLGVGQ